MTKVWARICYICWLDGVKRIAVSSYVDDSGDRLDVCRKHEKHCKEAGFRTTALDHGEVKREVV